VQQSCNEVFHFCTSVSTYSPRPFVSQSASKAFFARRETVYFGTFISAAISSHLVTPASMMLRNTSSVCAGLWPIVTRPLVWSVTRCHSNAGTSSCVFREGFVKCDTKRGPRLSSAFFWRRPVR
jgi:hypothetical protein